MDEIQDEAASLEVAEMAEPTYVADSTTEKNGSEIESSNEPNMLKDSLKLLTKLQQKLFEIESRLGSEEEDRENLASELAAAKLMASTLGNSLKEGPGGVEVVDSDMEYAKLFADDQELGDERLVKSNKPSFSVNKIPAKNRSRDHIEGSGAVGSIGQLIQENLINSFLAKQGSSVK